MKNQQSGNIALAVLIIATLVVVAGGGAYYFFVMPADSSVIPEEGTIVRKGTMACSPKKKYPATDECRYALLGQDNNYYLLNFPDNIRQFSPDGEIVVYGTFRLGDVGNYDAVGFIDVKEVATQN